MKKFKHVNTICNVEFYFEYDDKIYLKEQIHGSLNDQFTNHWYEVTKNGNWRIVKDNNILKNLESGYKDWYEKKYEKKLA
jgi:hypothetical protein